MTKRAHKVMLPRFGKYLEYLRKSKNLKQSQVIYKSKKIKDGCKISSSNLSRYEAGKTGDPSLPLLKTFSIIYDEPLENIIKVLMKEKYGVDIEYEKLNQSYIKESESIYIFQLEEINEMIKRLNSNGLFMLKAVLKGLTTQKEFLTD
ncbi:MAG: Helix-turn-helix domain protein [Candidatus Scalindua rubra]|uniref:Helix-turn-helix domain protein n=1 Tax=Candidatus Scalindua rubra TaxID=1872076 RepID=A0A1E3XBZ7_9BACT|nr:MAG: Helix-turn-helix domain protein [Candidatus Scalindua rubra]